MTQDRNFDNLIDKFERRVYDTVKGNWRLKLLKEDLEQLRNSPEKIPGLVFSDTEKAPQLNIWDAGCGFAQMGLWFAEAGHQLTLCDLSQKMLDRAQQNFSEANLNATFYQGAAQDLASTLPQFDLVLFHAVLEWLAHPSTGLETVCGKVKPGGYLSLLFYNRNAMVFNNVLKGAWRLEHILSDDYLGKGKNLTPPNPQYPEVVIEQLTSLGFSIQQQTGIRVFHDYMQPKALEKSDLDTLLALEYRHCRQPTYRHMGRYIHVLAKNNN